MSRRLKTQNFRRTDFSLFRELVGRIPREAALKDKGCLEGQRGPEALVVPHRQHP